MNPEYGAVQKRIFGSAAGGIKNEICPILVR